MKVSDILAATKHTWIGAKPVYVCTLTGSSDEIARGSTKEQALSNGVAALRALSAAHAQRAYFWSPSGRTCFVVSYRHGGWGYDIAGPDRRTSSCATGDTFAECCAAAKSHADAYEEA